MRWVLVIFILLSFLLIPKMTIRLRFTARKGRLEGRFSFSGWFGVIHLTATCAIYAIGPQWGIDLYYLGKKRRIPFALPPVKGPATEEEKQKRLKLAKFSMAAFKALWPKISIDSVSIQTELGLNDAAYTAITCGTIQAAVLGLCAAAGIIESLNLQITPYYGGFRFNASGGCIVSMRPWHIILALLQAALRRVGKRQPIRAGKAGYHGTPN